MTGNLLCSPSISSRNGSRWKSGYIYPPPTVVWGKERGLTKRLEIEPTLHIVPYIGLLFRERLDTLFTSSESKISEFTRSHVIGFVADLFFSTLESGFFPDSLANSPDTCEEVRKSCGFASIWIRLDGALRPVL